MMETNSFVHFENLRVLREISKLKKKKNELYSLKGPYSSDYISLSIKLDLLINRYVEEKIGNLI
jgi:hypothetical protein